MNHFFSQNYAPFDFRILAKMKDTTETVCQRKSSETAQQTFLKLCSNKGHIVKICMFIGNADSIFLRSNLYPFWTLAKIIFATQMKLVFCRIARHLNAWNCHSLYTAFSSNVGAWGMHVSLLTLSFINFSPVYCWLNFTILWVFSSL